VPLAGQLTRWLGGQIELRAVLSLTRIPSVGLPTHVGSPTDVFHWRGLRRLGESLSQDRAAPGNAGPQSRAASLSTGAALGSLARSSLNGASNCSAFTKGLAKLTPPLTASAAGM